MPIILNKGMDVRVNVMNVEAQNTLCAPSKKDATIISINDEPVSFYRNFEKLFFDERQFHTALEKWIVDNQEMEDAILEMEMYPAINDKYMVLIGFFIAKLAKDVPPWKRTTWLLQLLEIDGFPLDEDTVRKIVRGKRVGIHSLRKTACVLYCEWLKDKSLEDIKPEMEKSGIKMTRFSLGNIIKELQIVTNTPSKS